MLEIFKQVRKLDKSVFEYGKNNHLKGLEVCIRGVGEAIDPILLGKAKPHIGDFSNLTTSVNHYVEKIISSRKYIFTYNFEGFEHITEIEDNTGTIESIARTIIWSRLSEELRKQIDNTSKKLTICTVGHGPVKDLFLSIFNMAEKQYVDILLTFTPDLKLNTFIGANNAINNWRKEPGIFLTTSGRKTGKELLQEIPKTLSETISMNSEILKADEISKYLSKFEDVCKQAKEINDPLVGAKMRQILNKYA